MRTVEKRCETKTAIPRTRDALTMLGQPSAKVEHEDERLVDPSQLVETKVTNVLAEAARVTAPTISHMTSRRLAPNRHLGMEAGGGRRARGGADDDSRESEQVVRLDARRSGHRARRDLGGEAW